MRLSASALGLTLALLFLAKASNASTILPTSPAICAVNPGFCTIKSYVGATLNVTTGYSIYNSPGSGTTFTGTAGFSNSESYTNQYGYSGSASGAVDVNFGGIHTVLAANGSEGFPITGVGAVGSGANSAGYIIDWFGTDNTVPSGSKLILTYSIDASGATKHDSSSSYESDIYSTFFIDGNTPAQTCTNGTGAYRLDGNYATMCTTVLSIDKLSVVSFYLGLNSFVSSLSGPVTLDASNTAKITSVLIVDSNGNPLPNIQLYDASGYDYNNPISSAPPSALRRP